MAKHTARRFLADRLLLILLVALLLTLGLFLAGVFVYPFGLVVLLLLAIARVLHLHGKT